MPNERHVAEFVAPLLGVHTARTYDLSSPEAERMFEEMDRCAQERNYGGATYWEGQLQQYLKEEKTVKNVILTVGKTEVLKRLAGLATGLTNISHGVLGTSATAASAAQTGALAEVKRKVKASVAVTGTTLNVKFYFTKLDTSGTYAEWVVVIDGTDVAGTGIGLSRVLTGGWTKSLTEGMTISCDFTLT